MLISSPSKIEIEKIIKYFNNQNYIKAQNLALKITKNFPNHPFGWKALGAIYSQTGNMQQAIFANLKSLRINPSDGEAHSNLGNIYLEIGKLNDAEINCRKAIKLLPHLAEAHNNLGIILQKNEKFKDAEISFKKAIQLNPNLLEARVNLANIHLENNEVENAIEQFIKTIEIKPNFSLAYYSFGDALTKMTFKKTNVFLEEMIIKLLNKKIYARPKYIARPVLSLIALNPNVEIALNASFKKLNVKFLHEIISNLCKVPVFLYLMRITPIPDLEFESLLIKLRSKILFNLRELKNSPDVLKFQISLSLQCYVNEHIYNSNETEDKHLSILEKKIYNETQRRVKPCSHELLCLSSYKPLNELPWCNEIIFPTELELLKDIYISEPLEEKRYSTQIKKLKNIENKVSLEVRSQYEKNPYPRWINLSLRYHPKSISAYMSELKLKIYKDSILTVDNPKILVAGCGTGQNSIGTSSIFSNSNVLAIDLSLKSLSYALRKTKEFDISNINYMQADILDIELIDRKFDIIESSGVLHHMEKPLIGWEKLTKCLKSGGLMRIALYSKYARKDIAKTRSEINNLKIDNNKKDLKVYRKKFINSELQHEKRHTLSLDFYSLSTFRDLLFHNQEHQFTITQIKDSLDKLGLKFCGFDNKKAIKNFKLIFKDEEDEYMLTKWDEFERQNQNIFSGMYQFWCQKL
jgi:Tfp pilus assembly protein PilF/ubiquinone/menaquinone biosynthesis C-methylase UbiE